MLIRISRALGTSLLAVGALLILFACEGGGRSPAPAAGNASSFTIGGTISGLSGPVVLQDKGGDNLTLSANGGFTFATALTDTSTYAVSVLAQPAGQICSVSNGRGTVSGANVANVTVICAVNVFGVGGTVSGLSGSVVLQNNGSDNLRVSADGTFTFSTPVAQSSPYTVTVLTQPAGQSCSIANGTGTVAGANVTNVTISCAANAFTVGGTISGLNGTVVLQDNGGDNLTLSVNGGFTFATALNDTSTYAVSVLAQPAGQICSVSNGRGTVSGANVANVTVICAVNVFSVGGTVSGLSGSVVLQNNSGDNLTVSANGIFTFSTPVAQSSPYAVTVLTQPAGQSCSIANGTGTVAGANVTNVTISCAANAFTVGGTVSGLNGTVVLQNNGANNLTLSVNGGFTFASALTNTSPYAVTVLTQPADQTCTVANGSGALAGGNVINVAVTCTNNPHTIGGSVSGLSGTGLVLQDNGGDNLTVSANGAFAFSTSLTSGAAYSVTVLSQPSNPSQTCTVTSGSGTVGSANITNVSVSCVTNSFTVGGTVSGLLGTGLVLQDNGAENLAVSAGPFTFGTRVASGSTYGVTVLTQPTNPSQTCTVASGSGTAGSANITNVSISCVTNSFTVGGTVSGHNGTGLTLKLNGTTNLFVAGNGTFAFGAITDGLAYSVAVFVQPLDQTCTVANGSGALAGANVANIAVTCANNPHTIGGSVSGLSGTGLVLQDNGGDNLTVSANGAFAFSTSLTSGAAYSVTVLTQPTNPSQTCTVASGSGTVGSANITNVGISCTTNSFTVGGTVSGHNGTGLTLKLNGTTNLLVAGNGPFAFGAISDGSAYSVAVFVQPLDQTCTVANGSGTLAGANVTNVTVTCTNNPHTIGGSVSGLSGSGLVLQDNGGDNLTVSANGAFAFSTSLTSGAAYSVTVLSQPTNPSQTCTVAGGSGTVGSSEVTNVTVTCTPNTFTVGGTISGLNGTVVLQNNGGDDLTLSANGGFTFAGVLANTSPYAVTVLTQPARQTCTITNGTGTVAGANISNVTVSCAITQPSMITVSISPKLAGLTTSQTQVFNATVTNDLEGAGVSWTSTGGSLTSQTLTSVVFSSATAGSFTITATSVADSTKSASATIGATDLAGVFTQRYDAQRTGQNRQEFALTPGTVTPSTFGKLFSCAVDAEPYAQPLYVANFAIAGGTHNVVMVATQNDSVYAFDADANPCVQYWTKSFLGTGITTVPPGDTRETGDINTQIGITGTPVIDPATGTLYVVAKTKETVGTGCSDVSPCYFQRLHALDLATGNEKFGGPANISSAITVSGSGDTGDSTCPSSAGQVPFCPLRENQRPGLLLVNGKVYVAWASHGDQDPYHGWVIGYSAADLTQPPVVFNTTPDGSRGGIWNSGTGPAADASGNIYVITGNGTFDTTTPPPRTNYGDSFIKLTPGLSVADFFTPANQSFLDSNDFDVGSGGAIVVDSAGANPHLLIGGDKQGVLYVLDRDNMSGFNPSGDQILQTVPITAGPACIICGIFSTPAFWEGKLYVAAIGDVLKQYTLTNSSLSLLPALQAADMFGFPGASPAVSSNGATNGIVWLLDTSNNGTPNPGLASNPAILFAYDANNLTKLFSSPASGAGAAGNAVKFTVPTVANGKVYVGTQSELSVFGLLPN